MQKLKTYIWQLFVAIDQLLNVVALGMADETFSARCFRLDGTSRFWSMARRVVDGIFFFEKKHCWQAYRNEVLNAHKAVSDYQLANQLTVEANLLLKEANALNI